MTKQERKELRGLGRILQGRVALLENLCDDPSANIPTEAVETLTDLVQGMDIDVDILRRLVKGEYAR